MEMVEKFDNKRRPLSKTEDRYINIPNEYRQSVNVWIMNSKGEFLIQKRSPNKKSWPNIWSVTAGTGNIGETTLQTVIRECKEELSIDVNIDNLELMMTIKSKHTFTDVWLLREDIQIETIKLQAEEVTDVMWVSSNELKEMIKSEKITSNVILYFDFFETSTYSGLSGEIAAV